LNICSDCDILQFQKMLLGSGKMADLEQNNEYVKVAYYYYKTGLTQDEIAKKMFMSRQRVNRILKKCLELGIVKISIQECEQRDVELETQLEMMLGINEILVVEIAPNDDPYAPVGSVAANYLNRIIQNDSIIGFSRGRALSAVVDRLMATDKTNVTVTQLVGGLNAEEAVINSDSIVHRAAENLNAKPCFMYAPIVLENKKLRDALMKEDIYQQAYQSMKACTIALVGIGDRSQVFNSRYPNFISDTERECLNRDHAVGEVCTHYFDIDGKLIQSGIEDRVLAIDYDSLLKIPFRIGVACGVEKVQAMIGAVRGRFINVLITDKETARKLKAALTSK
jgi:deoxyribonucleoside regulator